MKARSIEQTARWARRSELAFWGFALAVAFSPWGTGWIAWIAFVRPLIIIGQQAPRDAFRSGYLFSLVFNLAALYWIGYVTPPGFGATCLILSLYPAAAFALYAAVYRRHAQAAILIFPVLWVGMEYFRGLSEFSFPWTDLSYAQAYYLNFIQLASLTGAAGLSLIVALCNSLLALALQNRARVERLISYLALAALIIAFPFGYGWVVTPAYQAPPEIRVGILQGDFPLEVKWSEEEKDNVFSTYDSLAALAGAEGAQLIVWPETAAPNYMLFDQRYTLEKTTRARASGAPNLIGTMHADISGRDRRYYNAAVQLESDGSFSAPYLKRRLVPFAEQVPYQDKIPFLKRSFLEEYLTFIKTYDVQWWSDFKPGDSTVYFEFDDIKYAPLICFEVAYPEYVRDVLRGGSQFILTITNDTWFKKSPGPYQHERIAIMRAVENRTWLVRAANSGFSFIADPYGAKRESLPWYVRGYLTGGIDIHYHPSFFYHNGPILGKYCFIYLCLLLLYFGGVRILRRFSPGLADR